MIKKEEILHLKVCDYLRKNYPDVLFRTDFSSGMKMTPGQAAKHKKFQKGRAWPDLFIAESNNFASGLFLEIKAENVIVFKKNGKIRHNKHLIEQDKMLKELRKKGYRARFAIGYNQAIFEIQQYLGEPKPKKVKF
nr:MAG TPA: Nuclease [Caudoviricetes sp.]